MSLSIGIVGLPNAGKSTLFNALIRRQKAQVGEHPFTTITPNKGMVSVPDECLERLSEVVENDYGTKPEIIPAKLTVIDIAGLIKGAHQGEGLGNKFLGHIREVDSLLHVVRAFHDKQIAHPIGSIDPLRDLEVVEMELVLADFSLVERHLSSEKLVKRQPILLKLYNQLKKGIPASKIRLSQSEKQELGYFPLLSQKPVVVVLNVAEADLGKAKRKIDEKAVIPICAKLEQELITLGQDEQFAYLREIGVGQSALEAVLAAAYHLLDLATIYTIAKGKKVCAWPVKTGTTIREAAGKIHTQMQRKFIKAVVINYSELLSLGSWHKAVDEGRVKTVGRDYLVKDGDVVEVKFSPT